MTADHYREKAQELLSLARSESNGKLQVAYAAMAQGYFRLADMAERNSRNYETPAEAAGA
jgi:hypothetical protein